VEVVRVLLTFHDDDRGVGVLEEGGQRYGIFGLGLAPFPVLPVHLIWRMFLLPSGLFGKRTTLRNGAPCSSR
jgi:hypothetical protein